MISPDKLRKLRKIEKRELRREGKAPYPFTKAEREALDRLYTLKIARWFTRMVYRVGQDIPIVHGPHRDEWHYGEWLTRSGRALEVRELGYALMFMALLETPGVLAATVREFGALFESPQGGTTTLTRVYKLLHGEKSS